MVLDGDLSVDGFHDERLGKYENMMSTLAMSSEVQSQGLKARIHNQFRICLPDRCQTRPERRWRIFGPVAHQHSKQGKRSVWEALAQIGFLQTTDHVR